MSTTPSAARDAIAALQGHEAWAIIRRSTRAGDRDTVGAGGRPASEVASILDIPLEDGSPPEGRHVRPAGRRTVPAGGRARLRGPRRRHPAGGRRRGVRAGVLGRRRDRRDRRRARRVRRPGRVRDRRRRLRQGGRGDHRGRDRPGRGRQPGDRPPLPRHRGRLGPRQGAGRVPAAARAGARRLLDLLLLHRRPLPDRRQPRAARQRARRRRPDEPDLRHLPGPPAEPATTGRSRPGYASSCATRRRSTSSSWSSTRSSR